MDFQPGDIAACFGRDYTSRAISLGTWSPVAPRGLRVGPSHVALMCEHSGDFAWVESTMLCRHRCLVRGVRTAGVQAHRPEERIADYVQRGGRVDVYRPAAIHSLSSDESALLSRILIERCVRPGLRYDCRGAVLSGTRAFQLMRLFPAADLERLFCSELVAAVLMRLGRMNHANPTRFNPARLLRTLVRTGVYRFVESCGAEDSAVGNDR